MSASIIRGPLVQEVHQRWNAWTSQVIRIYRGQRVVECVWMVGPLPGLEPGTPGLEVITRLSDHLPEILSFMTRVRYTSDINSGDKFLTDSNGRFMMERRRDFRPTWDLNLTEPVASNYFPVDSR